MTTPARDPADIITAHDAADVLGVPRGRIHEWAHRGRINPVGMLPGRGKPQPLYDLADLRPLADQWCAQRQIRRTGSRAAENRRP